MPTPKAIGDDGEQLALSYPQNNGLKLITRNLRQRSGEIDLIMQDAKVLVFIEIRRS